MRKGLNRYNFKSFLSLQKLGSRIGAIGLASLLWLFVVSENEYAMVVDMPIEARNLPARHALGEEVPNFAKVRLKGTGRSLFKTLILKQFIPDFKLVLDLERISEEYDFVLNEYFERYPQKVAIPSNFDVEYVEVIYPSFIHISLDEYKEKLAFVNPSFVIKPAPGYILVGSSKITPQSVKIAGSRNIVEGINSVSTIPDTIQNASSKIKLSLELSSIRGQLIEYTPKTVVFEQDIQSISERIISEIPVRIKNKKVELQAFVSPQTVSLTVVGGTDYIAGIEPEDIEVSIDFNNWNAKQQFYELEVITPNDVIKWMDLSPTQIELVVTRRVS